MPIDERVGAAWKEWERVDERVGNSWKQWERAWELQSDGTWDEIFGGANLYAVWRSALWRIDVSDPSNVSGNFGRLRTFNNAVDSLLATDDNLVFFDFVDSTRRRVTKIADPSRANTVTTGGLVDVRSDITASAELNGVVYIVSRRSPGDANPELFRSVNLDTGATTLIATLPAWGTVRAFTEGMTVYRGQIYLVRWDSFPGRNRSELRKITSINPFRHERVGYTANNIRIRAIAGDDSVGIYGIESTTGQPTTDRLWLLNPANPSDVSGVYGSLGAMPTSTGSTDSGLAFFGK